MYKFLRSPGFFLVILSLLFSACHSADAQPSATPTLQVPVQISSPTVRPTEIIIPTSTSAPQPSDTPKFSPTSPTPTPTLDWTTYDLDARASTSPDGMWVARIIVAYPPQDSGGGTYHTFVRVDSASAPISWTVVDEWLTLGLGMTTPFVLRWTEDGSSLFIADTGVPDGCGPSFVMNVRRVDLQSGVVTPLDNTLFGKLSVSPDGSTLVSFSQNTGLVAYDLAGEEPLPVAFTQPVVEDWWPGEIVWSPDGREFLFDLAMNPCSFTEEMTSSIWHASLEASEASPLILDDPNVLSLQSWSEACLVQLRDSAMGVWWLDPCTAELSQSSPTDVGLALEALLGLFDALHQRNYAQAAEIYGGSYETLQNNNPTIDPNDHAALLTNACEQNGYKCLPVLSYVLESQPGLDEFSFLVTFDLEGEAFVLGPCCGASLIDQPPVQQFTYTVKRDADGVYRVQGLPVYVP